MRPSFLAIIPARKGSKGIHNKNLVKLMNKPLLEWSLMACEKSLSVDKSIVSSDSNKILQLGEMYRNICHKRSSKLSGDSAKTSDVILNIFNDFPELKIQFSHFILLQPTSPLRTHNHIDEACKKIIGKNADSLISVCKTDNQFLKNLYIDDLGNIKNGFDKNFFEMPRQKLPSCFKPNGAIFISRVDKYIDAESFLQNKTIHYEMDSDSSIDIDSPADLIAAEQILKKNL